MKGLFGFRERFQYICESMKRKERTQKATHRFFRHEHHLLGYSAPDGAFDGFDFSIIL